MSESAVQLLHGPYRIRSLLPNDLRFIATAEHRADFLLDDATLPDERWSEAESRLGSFIDGVRDAGWIAEENDGEPVGVMLVRFTDIDSPLLPEWSIFRILDRGLFPSNGSICEVFLLWVDPRVRRHGVGTALKLRAESEALQRGASCIYTHTLVMNEPTRALNRKLSYREVRCCPIWDEEVRVSLLKNF